MRKISIFVVVVFIMLGMSGCTPSPQKVIKKMFVAMSKVDSYDLALNVGVNGNFPGLADLEASATELKPGTMVIKLDGGVDMKKDLKYDLSAKLDYKVADVDMALEGQIRYLDDNFFFLLNSVPQSGLELEQIKGNWYKFDFSDLGMTDLSKKERKVNEDKNNKLRKLISKTDFFEITKDYGLEDLDGDMVYHMEVKINADELVEFFSEATEIMEDRKLTKEEKQELEDSVQIWQDISGELWISNGDYLLKRFELGVNYTDSASGMIRYDLAGELANYNRSIEIEKPADVRDFNLMDVFMPGLGDFELPEGSIDGGGGFTLDKLKEIEGGQSEDMEAKLEELKKELEKYNVE